VLPRAIFPSATRLANASAIVYNATMYPAFCIRFLHSRLYYYARFFQNAYAPVSKAHL
jgi:hypothetical protein